MSDGSKKGQSLGLRLAVFVGVAGFWSMGLFAIFDGYWFASTAKLGGLSRMFLGDEARIHGVAFMFFGLLFLSLIQKNAIRGGLLAGAGILGALGCMLAPLYMK